MSEIAMKIKTNWHKVRKYTPACYPVDNEVYRFYHVDDGKFIEGYTLTKYIDPDVGTMPLFATVGDWRIWGDDVNGMLVSEPEVQALVERLIVQEAATHAHTLGYNMFAIYPSEYLIDPDVYDISGVFENNPDTAVFLGRNEREAARQVKNHINGGHYGNRD